VSEKVGCREGSAGADDGCGEGGDDDGADDGSDDGCGEGGDDDGTAVSAVGCKEGSAAADEEGRSEGCGSCSWSRGDGDGHWVSSDATEVLHSDMEGEGDDDAAAAAAASSSSSASASTAAAFEL
jgi:hypothetical protein